MLFTVSEAQGDPLVSEYIKKNMELVNEQAPNRASRVQVSYKGE